MRPRRPGSASRRSTSSASARSSCGPRRRLRQLDDGSHRDPKIAGTQRLVISPGHPPGPLPQSAEAVGHRVGGQPREHAQRLYPEPLQHGDQLMAPRALRVQARPEQRDREGGEEVADRIGGDDELPPRPAPRAPCPRRRRIGGEAGRRRRRPRRHRDRLPGPSQSTARPAVQARAAHRLRRRPLRPARTRPPPRSPRAREAPAPRAPPPPRGRGESGRGRDSAPAPLREPSPPAPHGPRRRR